MRWSCIVSTAPSTEPVTTAEAKKQLNLTLSDDDTYIGTLISAGRRWAEQYTRRSFVTQTRTLYLERFPSCGDCYGPYQDGAIWLPYGPKGATSIVITYDDTNGDSQTLSSSLYRVTAGDDAPRIEPAYGQIWPSTRSQSEAVQIAYPAGYGAASSVPEPIKQAILIYVNDLYEVRGDREPSNESMFSMKALLASYVCGWEW